ncbi:hypothetical protein [Streptomyces lavendofoliae]
MQFDDKPINSQRPNNASPFDLIDQTPSLPDRKHAPRTTRPARLRAA